MIASHDDVIVLDLATDRYLGLPAAVVKDGTPVAMSRGVTSLDPAAIDALLEAGLICIADHHTMPMLIELPSYAIDHHGAESASPSLRDVVDLGVALIIAGWRIWRSRPCRMQQTVQSETIEQTDPEWLHGHPARLRLLRLFIPTPRRCLPSALVTSLWLHRKGIATEIVFGVRTHPFEAHCWTEHGGIVLDDDLDRLHGYTPIAVGLP